MYRAGNTLTVVHHAKGANSDTYSCLTVAGSWYAQIKTNVGAVGLQEASVVKCRIPTDRTDSKALDFLASLCPGDKVLKGSIQSCDSAAFAALGRTQGAMTIFAVHDNSDGVHPHYYLEGAV